MSKRQKEALWGEFSRWGWDAKGWAPRTRQKYEQGARAADAWLVQNRNTSLLWASPKDLQAYLFTKPPNARTRNRTRQALVGFGEFLMEKGYADSNPALTLPRLPEPELLPKSLDFQQAERIAIAAEVTGRMEACVILLMLYGGLRKSEARLLEWGHIDPDWTWIRFTGKGNKQRAIPLHPKVQEALQSWRAKSKEARWVFPSPRKQGRPISETGFRVIVKEIGLLAGVEGLHPHLLRHTSASRLYEVQPDIRVLQEFLGHSDPKTSAIYSRVRPARLKEAVEQLDFRKPSEVPKSTPDESGGTSA